MASAEPGVTNVERAIVDAIARRLPGAGVSPSPAGLALRFEGDLGLSSLDLAELIAGLDDQLGVPARARVPIADLRTIADLCLAYRARLRGHPSASAETDALLLASRRRGDARRRRLAR